MKSFNPWLRRSSVVILGAAGVVLLLYSEKNEKGAVLPAKLGEMKLAQQLSGEAAQGMIDHLHHKGVTPQENFIGFYEGNGARSPLGQATLYVSVYADATVAKEVDRKMAQRIQAGNPVFGSFKEVHVAGQAVSECMGMGQVHCFFSRGSRLYWLGVDPPVAQRAVESLIRSLGQKGP